MRPKERRDSGQTDFFRARLDQIVDLDHALAKLGRAIDWRFLEGRFGAVYSDKVGHPPLPTRLMAGLAILKHMHGLSDEDLCARRVENPYYQLFCGEEVFQHKLTFDRSSLTRWRQRMGEERLVALIQESLAVATRTGAAKPADFSKVIVDTTVQPKAVAFPTDARLMHRARERLAKLARKTGLDLRQSYARVGKHALITHQRYTQAKQFKRANRALRTIRTYLGRVIRDIVRKIKGEAELESVFAHSLMLARRVREQRQHQRGRKVYSLHAPEVECIGKGKTHRPHEIPWEVDSDQISRQSGALTPSWRRKCKRLNHDPNWPLSALILPLRFDGTVSFNLGDHLSGSGSRRDYVQAFPTQRRCRKASAAFFAAQAEGANAHGRRFPDYCHPGSWAGWFLDPPCTGERGHRKPCGRSCVDLDLTATPASQDRHD